MNAKFEWFGFSVARKHVYFYALLAATTLAANSVKDSLIGSAESEQVSAQLAEVHERIIETQAVLVSLP